MNIRDAFDSIVSMLREHDGNFGRTKSHYVVYRNHLRHYGWKVFESAANAEADYLSEEYNVILTVTHRGNDAYLVYARPFTWEPHNQYGFSCKMFSHVFHKYDPQLVDACVKVATDNSSDSMLYSELVNANGVQRCHYGVKVYNNRTSAWEKVYEGTFPVES